MNKVEERIATAGNTSPVQGGRETVKLALSGRSVEFEAEVLGEINSPRHNETTGKDYVLYRTDEAKLLLNVYWWTCWEGERDRRTLLEVTPEQLGPTGEYWEVGQAAGFDRPLTLAEALELQKGDESVFSLAARTRYYWVLKGYNDGRRPQ